MKKAYDFEYNFPSDNNTAADIYNETENKTDMDKEFLNAGASNIYADELNSSHRPVVTEDNKNSHNVMKRSILLPLASVVAVLSVVYSSYHYDVLGYDLFGTGSAYDDYYYNYHDDGYYHDYYDDYYDDYDDYPPESNPYYDPGEDVTSYNFEDMPLDYLTISPTYTARELESSRRETTENGIILINETYKNVVFHVADDVSGFSEVSSQGDARYIINEMKSRGLYVSDMYFREETTTGGELENTGLFVGDPDDLENVYIVNGELSRKWVHEMYYDVYITASEPH